MSRSCRCFALVVLLSASLAFGAFELFDYNPVADPSAVVVIGNARFTVLTDRIIRMEYNTQGSFVDSATLAFVNRKLPVPAFTSKTSGGVLSLQTSGLSLTYTIGAPFSSSSLNITVRDASVSQYHFGDVDYGNLLGTIKSLDELGVVPLNCTLNANIRVHDESLHCAWGLVSTGGWTTVDDSDNYLLDPTSGWWTKPNPNTVDTYFFGHGSNYTAALADYVKLGGAVAMPPRAANGIMWSRWYNMNNYDVDRLIEDYENRALPMDCYILDMDWHTKQGWGGYSFDKSLFPIPEATMIPIRQKGILTSGNLHDLDGVRPNEDQYVPFCKAIGVDPSQNQTIAFAIANETYALALEDYVLKPLEDAGFGDFWWIDWQQGGKQGGCPGGKANPTIWLNRIRATDKIRRGQSQRGMVLARWGGLGNHRYQVGFSGDVQDVTWANLAYQPYFSLTASNVLYGQWSHDIVGNAGDFELYTRWVQWGAMSSVMRSHDRGMASGTCSQNNPPDCGIVKVWDVPTPYFEANRAALQARHRLLPYLYNAQRKYFETGISLMRPMYYAYGQYPGSYWADENGNFPQYMLGDDMMVSPIVSAGFSNDTLARQTVWIPPGTWIEGISGNVITSTGSGMTYTRAYHLSEIPIFYRAGAVIPRIPLRLGNTLGRASQQYTELDFEIHAPPGTQAGGTVLYEDDGISTDYATKNAFFKTSVSFTRSGTNTTIVIGAPSGQGYSAFPKQRSYTFRFVASPPSSVTVNGQSASWRFDGPKAQMVVSTGVVSTSSPVVITYISTDSTVDAALFGVQGMLSRANLAKEVLDPSWSTPGAQTVERARLSSVASVGTLLSYYANSSFAQFKNTVLNLPTNYVSAVSEVLGIKPNGNMFPSNALVQWWSATRQDNCLCGSNECNELQAESGYTFVRIEGYVPENGAPGSTPLFEYWNPTTMDNFATTNSTIPSGYQAAIFSNGSVFTSASAGIIPLQTWWSNSRKDWLTTSTQAGVNYAKANGYVLGSSSIGYVYANAPLDRHAKRDSVTPPTLAQWSESYDLLRF